MKKLLGENEVEPALQRLDRLTQDEIRVTLAETLHLVYGLDADIKILVESEQHHPACLFPIV